MAMKTSTRLFAGLLSATVGCAAAVVAVGPARATPVCERTMSVDSYTAAEGSAPSAGTTPFRFIVKTKESAPGCANAAIYRYQTVVRSAKPGSDYQATSGYLGWSDGDLSMRNIDVGVVQDNIAETDESFLVQLCLVRGSRVSPSMMVATGTIVNDDPGTSEPGGGNSPDLHCGE